VDLGQEWPQPLDELETLRHELRQYSRAMAEQRPWAIAANKCDLPLALVSNYVVITGNLLFLI
jgi:GTPase involved in cell partitioning and DNA repair